MRVTNNMLSQNLLKNLQNANGKMDVIQQQLATGQRINKPSDDPSKIETSMRLKNTLSAMEQWKENAGQGLAFMDTAEGILNGVTSMLQRLKELAVQGGAGSNAPEDLKQIKVEVEQLAEQMRLVANSQYGAKYIFSGTNIDQIPMPNDLKDSDFVWQGNDKRLEAVVGSNLNMPISVDGKYLFGVNDSGDQSSVFETFSNFIQALDEFDLAGIDQALGEIDEHTDRVLAVRAELGAKTNRMEIIKNQLDYSLINLKQNMSNIQDVDMAGAIMEFQSVQNTFRAALAVGSQIIQPSLVDFLR